MADGMDLGGANFKVHVDMASFDKELAQLEKQTRQWHSKMDHGFAGFEQTVAKSSKNAAYSLLQLGYAVDDLQYGFNAIVNNIPQVLMFMGPGIAGAAGVAAVAINTLYNHWGQLSDMLQGAWYGDAPGQLKALREGAEAAAAAFEKLAATPTKGHAAESKGIGEAVTETGANQLATALAIRMRGNPNFKLKSSDIDISMMETVGDLTGIAPINRERKIGEAYLKKAQGIIGGAVGGNKGDIAWLKKFAPEIAQDIEDASPEGQRRIAQKNLDLAGGRLGRKQEEKAADKDKKLVHELNQAGRDNQLFGEAKARDARLQDLNDKREAAVERHHQEDLMLQRAKERLGHPMQMLSGAKAVVDYYQKGVGDAPLVALAKATKQIQEDQRTELKGIHDELKKEQRVKPG